MSDLKANNEGKEARLVTPVFPFIREKKYKRPEDMKPVMDQYFSDCDYLEKPYSVEGLTLALGFSSTKTLLNYGSGEGYEDFFHLVKSAKMKITAQRVERMQTGKMHVVAGIFLLSNNSKEDYQQKPEALTEDGVVKSFLITMEGEDNGGKDQDTAEQKTA